MATDATAAVAHMSLVEPRSPEEVTDEDRAAAEALKDDGNKLFAARHYPAAIEAYTKAIARNPFVASYYSNRAAAYIREEFLGYAIADANKAIEIDPKFIKAYYRRASANMGLSKIKEAVRDFRTVVKFAPQDADAKGKLSECEKELRRRQFESAISVQEQQVSALERIGDIDSIIVEPSYDGPHLEVDPETKQDVITEDFTRRLMEDFKSQKKLHRKYAYKILKNVKELLSKQKSLVDISVPDGGQVIVCGDIHGQYYDLLNIFEQNGLPSAQNVYLFNGDFVDRGSFSVECILVLFAFKWLFPEAFFLTRGNHEADDMNKVYGFEGEVKAKFNDTMFKLFSEVFDAIPVANVIENKVFVVHGGLPSQENATLDDIRNIDRYKQPGSEGLMADLLWADPQPMPGRGPSKRGVGLQFGPDVTSDFLKRNNLELLIRSHEVKEAGYEIEHGKKCVTVFSAPNYVDQMGNMGCVIAVKKRGCPLVAGNGGYTVTDTLTVGDFDLQFRQFSAVPHPVGIKPMQYAGRLSGLLGA
ncbi:Serine/threonine-protein phosphatase 5 [Hyaloraphidium curvatum]|nr:Serine/threonine-protein phosphatase 5 [Hyaloraphidium curvatum]